MRPCPAVAGACGAWLWAACRGRPKRCRLQEYSFDFVWPAHQKSTSSGREFSTSMPRSSSSSEMVSGRSEQSSTPVTSTKTPPVMMVTGNPPGMPASANSRVRMLTSSRSLVYPMQRSIETAPAHEKFICAAVEAAGLALDVGGEAHRISLRKTAVFRLPRKGPRRAFFGSSRPFGRCQKSTARVE